MGYRHYFYKVNKKEVETVKDMSLAEVKQYAKAQGAEVVEDDDWFYFNDRKFMDKTEVFEFGKLYWDDTADRIYAKGVPLFNRQETQEAVEDYYPYVVGKEGVLEAITIYREKILDYYKSFIADGVDLSRPLGLDLKKEGIKSIDELVEHIRDKVVSLCYRDIANTDESNKWTVTSSWEYEHSIFNLVHILKTIDWEQDTILFYGW